MVEAKTTAHDAAVWLLHYAGSHGDYLTNLKLQKLLYYAQAWHLALFDQPLFDDEVQAWVHGPVIPSVYHEYKYAGWQPISLNVMKPVHLHSGVEAHLTEIYRVYGGYTGHQLELMTHNETPWQQARGGLPLDAICESSITWDAMRQYYKAQLH